MLENIAINIIKKKREKLLKPLQLRSLVLAKKRVVTVTAANAVTRNVVEKLELFRVFSSPTTMSLGLAFKLTAFYKIKRKNLNSSYTLKF
jgi:hypothetical protein